MIFFVNVGPDLDTNISKINQTFAAKYSRNRNKIDFTIAHISSSMHQLNVIIQVKVSEIDEIDSLRYDDMTRF